MSDNKGFSSEDYLRLHLQSLESNTNDKKETETEIPLSKPEFVRSNELQYFSFDMQELPCNIFYPKGTLMQIRAAQVKEIQSYSMVDDTNYYDILEKMNDMLSSCVKIKHHDGRMGTYMDLKDPDRYYLIFLIRELSFQKGTTLSTTVNCSCGKEVVIELIRSNFKRYDIDEKLKPYYDPRYGCFRFELTNDKTYHLSPPTIGIQKSFTEYIIKQNVEKKKPNLSFLKIAPFTLVGRSNITVEDIENELEKFEKIDDVSFQFLNSAVEKMTFGIEELVKYCQCGLEIHTPMTFPHGPSAIFVVHDAFDQFIKK